MIGLVGVGFIKEMLIYASMCIKIYSGESLGSVDMTGNNYSMSETRSADVLGV